MKKKIVTLLAAALMAVAFAAPAMAAFENYDLVRIVYNTAGTQEIYTDLGNVNTAISNPATLGNTSFITGQTGSAAAGTLDSGTLFGNTALSNLNVAYVAFDTANSNVTYTSAGATAPSSIDNGVFYNSIGSFQGYLKGLTITNGNGIGNATNPNSYASIFQAQGAGLLGGMLDVSMEANLAALASGGTVTQHLYFFADNSAGTAADTGLTLTTNSTGTTSSTPTPIPPSFLLMGSGLLGMVGIRRKFNA